MIEPRERLLMLAQRAGYSPGALERLAQATLPGFVAGQRLDDQQVLAVCAAVEVCAQGGVTDEHVYVIVDGYRAHFGEQWRARFWRRRVRTANLRHEHPELYGPSPCDLPTPLHPGAPGAGEDSLPRATGAIAAARDAVRADPPTAAPDPGADATASFNDSPPPITPAERPPERLGLAAAVAPAPAAPVSLEIHPAIAAAPVLRGAAYTLDGTRWAWQELLSAGRSRA